MKDRKDGRYLNCYITRSLLDEFETICYAQGRTKTGVLEDAMQTAIEPFYDKNSELNLRDGVYKIDNPKKPGKIKKVPCLVIDDVTICGWPYYKIWVDGDFLSVPSEMVDIS